MPYFRSGDHAALTSDQVAQRDILWLPPRDTINSKHPDQSSFPVLNITTKSFPTSEFYNHPILVISRPKEHPDKIYFLQLTTYGGKTLAQRFRGRRKTHHWRKHFTLQPCANHPLWQEKQDANYAPLTFEGGPPSNAGGYVNVGGVCEMQWRDVERYWVTNPKAPTRTRLDEASFRRVLSAVKQFTQWAPKVQLNENKPAIASNRRIGTVSAVQTPASMPVASPTLAPVKAHVQPFIPATAYLPVQAVAHRSTTGEPWATKLICDTISRRPGHESLLPQYQTNPRPQAASRDTGPTASIGAWIWSYLKGTRLGRFFNFVSGGVFWS